MKKMVLILLFFLFLSLFALRVELLRPCLVDELLRLCLVDELRLPERSPRLLFLLLYILLYCRRGVLWFRACSVTKGFESTLSNFFCLSS